MRFVAARGTSNFSFNFTVLIRYCTRYFNVKSCESRVEMLTTAEAAQSRGTEDYNYFQNTKIINENENLILLGEEKYSNSLSNSIIYFIQNSKY
jgi:hypothetical protein